MSSIVPISSGTQSADAQEGVGSAFEELLRISATLQTGFAKSPDPWVGSPFAWILKQPSRQRGATGEQLVRHWCLSRGLSVRSPGDSEADLVIGGRRIEVKFSTLWAGGEYVFQQIRDQRYELAFLLGISPFGASCWVVPKFVLMERPFKSGMSAQHGGKAGHDTAWLRLPAVRPPSWLSAYGGTLEEGLSSLLAAESAP